MLRYRESAKQAHSSETGSWRRDGLCSSLTARQVRYIDLGTPSYPKVRSQVRVSYNIRIPCAKTQTYAHILVSCRKSEGHTDTVAMGQALENWLWGRKLQVLLVPSVLFGFF